MGKISINLEKADLFFKSTSERLPHRAEFELEDFEAIIDDITFMHIKQHNTTIDTTELKDITCRVCNAKFLPQKENRYIAEQTTLSFRDGMTRVAREAFDCPVCGCQNLVGVYSPRFRSVPSQQKE